MKIVRRLLHFLSRSKGMVFLSIGLGWATTVSWIALVSTSSWLISYAALQPSIAELQVAIVGVRFFGISRGVFRYLERLVSHTVTFRLLARLRTWMYEKLEPLAPAGLSADTSGDLLSALVDDIETLQEFYIRVVAPPVVALTSSILVLAVLGQWSIWFALTLLSFQIFTGILIPLAARGFGERPGRRLIKTRAAISHLTVDVVQGSADILLNGLGHNYIEQGNELIETEQAAERQQNRIFGAHSGLTAFMVNGSLVCLLALAIPLVSAGNLDRRLLAVIALGALASFESILPLGEIFQRLEESLGAGERVFQLADRVAPPAGEVLAPEEVASIEFRDIKFAYRHSRDEVLRDFSLEIPQGKKVAVVGPSGAGKSTLINLLLNFWTHSEGELLINGQDILQLDPESVRSLFSYLPQNPFLFNTTVIENIRIGNPEATREKVEEAAQKAGLADFILQLPDQYETKVGEFGVLLSGGQRQRLALGRVFVRDAPVMILDEPTANLDLITGREVLKKVFTNLSDRSLLLISHDLWGLEEMDEIILLESGKVVERGSQADLIRLGGRFARMLADQQDILFDD